MIIDPHLRGGYRSMADYLKDQGDNEETRIVHISDPDASNLDEAFHNMWSVACNSKAEKPLLHFSINPDRRDRYLTDDEAVEIAHNFMKRCHLHPDNHQMTLVAHILEGRLHFHCVVNRISLKTGKAVDPGKYHYAKMNCAREMEKKLGLRSPFSASEKEVMNAEALGLTTAAIDQKLFQAYTAAKNGRELITFIAEAGFILLQGRPNRRGEPTILVQDKNAHIYRLTALLMRSDIDFRKKFLMQKLGESLKDLPRYQPRHGPASTSWRAPSKGVNSPVPPRKSKKKGESSGSGGAMGSKMSPFKKLAPQPEPSPPRTSGRDPMRGNGPERRHKKLWVAVERREQKPH